MFYGYCFPTPDKILAFSHLNLPSICGQADWMVSTSCLAIVSYGRKLSVMCKYAVIKMCEICFLWDTAVRIIPGPSFGANWSVIQSLFFACGDGATELVCPV